MGIYALGDWQKGAVSGSITRLTLFGSQEGEVTGSRLKECLLADGSETLAGTQVGVHIY